MTVRTSRPYSRKIHRGTHARWYFLLLVVVAILVARTAMALTGKASVACGDEDNPASDAALHFQFRPAKRVMQAMLKMTKIDIESLKRAAAQP